MDYKIWTTIVAKFGGKIIGQYAFFDYPETRKDFEQEIASFSTSRR